MFQIAIEYASLMTAMSISAGVPVVLFSGNGVSERTQTIAATKGVAALL